MNLNRVLASTALVLTLSGCALSKSLVTDHADYDRVPIRLEAVHRDLEKLSSPGGTELVSTDPPDLRCVDESGDLFAPSASTQWQGSAAGDALAQDLLRQGWTEQPAGDAGRRFHRVYPEGWTASAVVLKQESGNATVITSVEPDGCSAVDNLRYPADTDSLP